VGPLLHREGAVGVGGLDLEGGRLDAGLLGVGGVVDLCVVAVPFRPAQVHPQQHLGEVGGVDPAGLRADGDHRLPLVVFAGQQGTDLLGLDLLAQGDELRLGLGVGLRVLVAELEHHLQVVQALPEVFDPLQLGLGVGQPAGDLLRVLLVVPQVGGAGRLGQLVDGALQPLDVHDRFDTGKGGVQGLDRSRVVEIHSTSAYADAGDLRPCSAHRPLPSVEPGLRRVVAVGLMQLRECRYEHGHRSGNRGDAGRSGSVGVGVPGGTGARRDGAGRACLDARRRT
jgi:hypothetical protein